MKKLKALIVDDSKVMRLMVMKTLRRARIAEFTFEEAGDGVEALARYDEGGYEILFLDWNMPGMSGIDLLRTIRIERGDRSVPVVMITSEKSTDHVEQALGEAGATAYVAKPFTADQLEEKLQPVIDAIGTDEQERGLMTRLFG